MIKSGNEMQPRGVKKGLVFTDFSHFSVTPKLEIASPDMPLE